MTGQYTPTSTHTPLPGPPVDPWSERTPHTGPPPPSAVSTGHIPPLPNEEQLRLVNALVHVQRYFNAQVDFTVPPDALAQLRATAQQGILAARDASGLLAEELRPVANEHQARQDELQAAWDRWHAQIVQDAEERVAQELAEVDRLTEQAEQEKVEQAGTPAEPPVEERRSGDWFVRTPGPTVIVDPNPTPTPEPAAATPPADPDQTLPLDPNLIHQAVQEQPDER